LLFTLLIFLMQCSFKGTYTRRFERLIINNDSTFEYFFDAGWNKRYAFGTWHFLSKGKILISSDIDMNNIPVTVTKTNSNRNELLLNPKTTNEKSVMEALTYEIVNNHVKYSQARPFQRIQLDSITELTNLTIRISLPPEQIRPYVLRKEINSTNFNLNQSLTEKNLYLVTFPLNLDMFYSEYVDRDTLELQGKKIFWRKKGPAGFKKVSATWPKATVQTF
jgi:hypothetical protein